MKFFWQKVHKVPGQKPATTPATPLWSVAWFSEVFGNTPVLNEFYSTYHQTWHAASGTSLTIPLLPYGLRFMQTLGTNGMGRRCVDAKTGEVLLGAFKTPRGAIYYIAKAGIGYHHIRDAILKELHDYRTPGR